MIFTALTGCKKHDSFKQESIKIAFIKDPSTFDPRKAHDLASTSLSFMLYEGLFRSNSSGKIENAICDSVTISKDEKNYRFKLKKTFWSDGTPVTAYDFEYSWLSQLDPQFPAPYAYLFYPIKNAKLHKQGKCQKKDVGIKALDSQTLEIKLDDKKNDFIDLLTFSAFFPVKQSKESKIFNGPFKLKLYKPHQEIILKKNLYFNVACAQQAASITIKIIDSENTAFELFKCKQLDVIGGPLCPVPSDALKTQTPSHIQSMAGATLCAFNTRSKIFANLNMRKAFSYAVDFEKIYKMNSFNNYSSKYFLPFNSSPLPSNDIVKFDPILALECFRKGMLELGISQKDLKHLRYYFGSKPEHLKLASILHECWHEHLGIDVELVKQEHKLLASRIVSKNFDFAQIIWLAPYDSPLSLLDRFQDENLSKNFSSYSSDNLKNLIKEFEKAKDPHYALAKIELELANNIPFIPLSNWSYPYFISSNIKNLTFTKLGTINFTFLEVNEDTCRMSPP